MTKLLNSILYFLWNVTGDDPRLIKSCSQKVRLMFGLIGLLIIIIIGITIFSVQILIASLFKSELFGVVIGTFFAFIISVHYLLLLQTLTPNLLPHKKPKFINVSRYIRFGSVIFLSIFIAKPIEINLFKKDASLILQHLKVKTLTKLESSISASYKSEQDFIAEQLSKEYISNNIRVKYEAHLRDLKAQKSIDLVKAKKVVDNSTFFSQKLIQLNRDKPWMWIISSLFAFLFLLPIILKINIPESSIYMQDKRLIERKIVEDHYGFTRSKYQELFFQRHGRLIKMSERFVDAPYNLMPKLVADKKNSEQKDLIQLIYKK